MGPLKIGDMFQHYEIAEILGIRKKGPVYRVRDTKLRRVAVVRLLNIESQKEQFLEKAAAIAQLEHFNIVRIFEVGREPVPYLVMEYVGGKTLQSLIQEMKMNTKQLLALFPKIAEALHEAHRKKIVHGAIRPSNIKIHENTPKIMDFGLLTLSAAEDSSEISKLVYMSPQQAKGNEVEKSDDIYSFGATMYECFSGRPPFYGDSRLSILSQIEERSPLPPTALNPDLPLEMEAICLKALNKSLDQRYSNARQIQRELLQFLDHRPITPSPKFHLLKNPALLKRGFLMPAIIILVTALTLSSMILRENQRIKATSAKAEEELGNVKQELDRIEQRAAQSQEKSDRYLDGARGTLDILQQMYEEMQNKPDFVAGLKELFASLEKTGIWGDLTSGADAWKYLRMYGLVYGKSKNPEEFEKGLRAYDRIISDHGKEALPYIERANIYSAQKRYEEAERDLEQALQIAPDSSLAYEERGNLRYERRRYAEAEQDYGQALRLKPQCARIYNRLGLLYSTVESFLRAEESYGRAIVLDFRFAEAYVNRGNLFMRLGRYEEAERDYNWAIQCAPDSPKVYQCRGDFYYFFKRYPAAERDYNEAIRLDPNYVAAYTGRAYLYCTQGFYPQAEEDYKQAIGLAPDRADVYNNRGYLYYLQGRHTEARKDFDQAIRLDSAFESAYNNRGLLNYTLGNYVEAERDYNQAVAINPRFFHPYLNLGILYTGQNRYEKAEDNLHQAMILSPNNPYVYLHLGNLHFQMKQYDKAISEWQKAIELNPSLRSQLEQRIKQAETLRNQ